MDKIEIGNPVRIQDHTLVPIEKTFVVHQSNRKGFWCCGSKQLVALVVQTAASVQAYRLEGDEAVGASPIPISELRNIVPDIEARFETLATR